jgi:phosphate uptake regulator
METRKVQVTGKSTYVVSLPKKWVNSVSLKNGNSVGVIPLPDGTLLINPHLHEKERFVSKQTILVNDNDGDRLFRNFIAAYLAGFNLIEFRSADGIDLALKQRIRKLPQFVIGPQVVDETENAIVMKDMLDASDFSIGKGLKRMSLIAKDMHHQAIRLMSMNNPKSFEEIASRENEVDRFHWMITKQYNLILKDVFYAEKLKTTTQEALSFLHISNGLERVADHAMRIANMAEKICGRPGVDGFSKEAEKVSNQIMLDFEEAVSCFFRQKLEDSYDVVARTKRQHQMVDALRQSLMQLEVDHASLVALAYIVESLERTRSYTEDIAEIGINNFFVREFGEDLAKKTNAQQSI